VKNQLGGFLSGGLLSVHRVQQDSFSQSVSPQATVAPPDWARPRNSLRQHGTKHQQAGPNSSKATLGH